MTDAPAGPQRPYVFSVVDGQLHAAWSAGAGAAGTGWTWTNIGAPGARVVDGADAVTVQSAPGGATLPYVFVRTDDGRLWQASGAGPDWSWRDLGTPPGTTIMRTVGAVAVCDSAGAAPLESMAPSARSARSRPPGSRVAARRRTSSSGPASSRPG